MQNVLLQKDFRPKGVTNFEDIIKTLTNSNFQVLILDCPSKYQVIFKLIEFMQANVDLKYISIFVHTDIRDKQFIVKCVQNGISGLIYKPYDSLNFIHQLSELLSKQQGFPEKRQHIRITPFPNDHTELKFFPSEQENNKITAEIINLSYGGAALELQDKEVITTFSAGQEIKQAQITLNESVALINFTVINIRKNILAIRFQELSLFSQTVISSYICDKLIFY
jgi:DNA-binding response OmpR family regulator